MARQRNSLDKARAWASTVVSGRQRPWSWLAAARVGWIALTLALLIIFLANIPAFYQAARMGCALPTPLDCGTGLLTTGNAQALAHLHVSITAAADVLATLTLIEAGLYWAVGLLIFWRKSLEWVGLFYSLLFVLMGATGMYAFSGALTPPLIQFLTTSAEFVLNPVAGMFFLTFPTGRFTPWWTWLAFALYLASTLPFMPGAVIILTIFLPIGVQVYRYTHIYDAVQRQQTKWFVFGFGAVFALIVAPTVLTSLAPSLGAPDSWFQLLSALGWPMIWTVLLVSVSVAVFRYRLWDIDVVINRTLVYGSLTAVLVGLYIGLIVVLGALVRAVAGNFAQQPLVIVFSTLVIAILFQPLRRRVQSLVDRRFYRRKYDAARVVETFSAELRTEMDPDQIQEHVLAIVQETMQPSWGSLWLRELLAPPPPLPPPLPQPTTSGIQQGRLPVEEAG